MLLKGLVNNGLAAVTGNMWMYGCDELHVKFGFMSLSLFDAEQLDCILDALCTE